MGMPATWGKERESSQGLRLETRNQVYCGKTQCWAQPHHHYCKASIYSLSCWNGWSRWLNATNIPPPSSTDRAQGFVFGLSARPAMVGPITQKKQKAHYTGQRSQMVPPDCVPMGQT
jgi:hypothetical protein